MAFVERPPAITLVVARDVPPPGLGDTFFASTALAYRALPHALRRRLSGLRVRMCALHEQFRYRGCACSACTAIYCLSGLQTFLFHMRFARRSNRAVVLQNQQLAALHRSTVGFASDANDESSSQDPLKDDSTPHQWVHPLIRTHPVRRRVHLSQKRGDPPRSHFARYSDISPRATPYKFWRGS